jgi:hypothetical protein
VAYEKLSVAAHDIVRLKDSYDLAILKDGANGSAIRLIEVKLARTDQANEQISPPVNAQFLLDLFLSDDVCEAFLGDLQERYGKKLKRLGKTRADWWYWKQVVTSLWPLARSAGRKVSWGMVSRVAAFVLRLAGFAPLADAIKKAAEEERRRTN